MERLGIEDFVKIMVDTKHGIINQTVEMMRVEGLDIAFSNDAIYEIAKTSYEMNHQEDLGARRIRTVLD
jgi:ATP-dependent HslUV protease ATP-binding subunit HslU